MNDLNAPPRILPTIGRIVHFYNTPERLEDDMPLAAIVTEVSPRSRLGEDFHRVGLVSFPPGHGTVLPATNVPIFEPRLGDCDNIPAFTPHARWMPFQLGQAAQLFKDANLINKDLIKPGPLQVMSPPPDNAPVLHGEQIGTPEAGGGTPPAFVGTLNEAVKGLTGPHISAEDVNAAIAFVAYFIIGVDRRTTICEITLQNGFTVRGEASVLRKENFNLEVGKKLSYQDAWKKIWQLEAYLLATKLNAGGRSIQHHPV